MASDYRQKKMQQNGENANIFASCMQDDDDDDNALVESVEGRVLKVRDDALLTVTLSGAALNTEEERKSSLSLPGWFDAQEDYFDFTSPSRITPTQQPSSVAQHTIQQFQSYGSGKAMQDPLYNPGTSSESNSNDGCEESISVLEQGFQSPRKEPEHKKTTTFANVIATPFSAQDGFFLSESSSQTLDILRDESSNKAPSSNSMLGDSSSDMGDDEDDKHIIRQILYAFGGVGFFALMGLAGNKLLKPFRRTVKDTQDIDGDMSMTNVADQAANDNNLTTAVAGDTGTTYTPATATATQQITAFQTSDIASQSQISTKGGFGMNPGGGADQAASGNTFSAAQSQVMQIMAVNAASNAASIAVTAASGLASAASAAAAAAAGTTVATTMATVSTIVAAVRSSLYEEKIGALVFGSLAHLSVLFLTM
jgi:hypothetical protein